MYWYPFTIFFLWILFIWAVLSMSHLIDRLLLVFNGSRPVVVNASRALFCDGLISEVFWILISFNWDYLPEISTLWFKLFWVNQSCFTNCKPYLFLTPGPHWCTCSNCWVLKSTKKVITSLLLWSHSQWSSTNSSRFSKPSTDVAGWSLSTSLIRSLIRYIR